MKKDNPKKETKKKVIKKKIPKKEIEQVVVPQIVKAPHAKKRQKALNEKKAKLAKKARQTKWAPVWVVMKKFGIGKRIHPSSITRYKRSWRRTKLHIKPRRQKKSHFG